MKKRIGPVFHVFIFLLIGLGACVPTSTPDPTHTPIQSSSVSGWEVYRNETYAFAFNYPKDVTIEVSEKHFEIRVSTTNAMPFSISATRDYLPGDVIYFLDTPSSEQRVLGEHTWQTYILPDGYCDGSVCSSSIYALQMEVGQVLYRVVFYEQTTMNPLQEQILSTFQVLS